MIFGSISHFDLPAMPAGKPIAIPEYRIPSPIISRKRHFKRMAGGYSNFGCTLSFFWKLCDRAHYARYYWDTTLDYRAHYVLGLKFRI